MKPAIEPVMRMRPLPLARMSRPTLWMRREGAANIGIHDAEYVAKILVEKRPAQTSASVRKKGVNVAALDGLVKLLDPFRLGKVSFDCRHASAESFEILGCGVDPRLVSSDDEIKTLPRAAFGEFIADPRRGACHDRKRLNPRPIGVSSEVR